MIVIKYAYFYYLSFYLITYLQEQYSLQKNEINIFLLVKYEGNSRSISLKSFLRTLIKPHSAVNS